MGAQQVLRAAAAGVLIAAQAVTASAAPAAPAAPVGPAAAPVLPHTLPRPAHERVAVIDLGPADDGAARRALGAAVVAAGLEPVTGDGVEDALAGRSQDKDAVPLAAAMADASKAFGALDCTTATRSARYAIAIAAGRQAAGLPAPELPTAWSYVLLCADRAGDTTAASLAATRLRALGATSAVDAAVLARYPEIDAIVDREVVAIDVTTTPPGAAIWIDFQRAGTSPLHVDLPAGEHLIAAALGSQRGVVTGTVVPKQPVVPVPMHDEAGRWAKLAARIAGWKGNVPPPAELAWVLDQVHARVALVRHGNVVEAWGRVGRSEPPHRLGEGADATMQLADASRAAGLIADRVQTWNDHAPDPDRPLLVEDIRERAKRLARERHDEPTPWYVYATIGAALLAGGIAIYAHDHTSDTQRVELHFP